MSMPLEGVRVLDFTHLLPGELCSTLLSDLGADVVRIENPEPGLSKKLPPIVHGESLFYWSVHRNKRHIAVDLKQDAGKELVMRLVEESAVLLENFRPGVMSRLGLGYKDLSKINKSLVYCSISGYGQNTSWSQKPGHDLNFLAESGIIDLTRRGNDRPVLPGALIADYMSAVYAALAVTSALLHRQQKKKGKSRSKGKWLDISMFESALATQNIIATAIKYTGESQQDAQYRFPTELPNYSVYECKDGKYLAVASLEPQFWHDFCRIIERPDLAEKNITKPDAATSKIVAASIKTHTQEEWLERFAHAPSCVSAVNRVEEALELPPIKERLGLLLMEHPILGLLPQLSSPMLTLEERELVQDTPFSSVADSHRLLRELGYSKRQIEKLTARGIVRF